MLKQTKKILVFNQHNRYELMVEVESHLIKTREANFYLHEHDEAEAETFGSCCCRCHDTHDVL